MRFAIFRSIKLEWFIKIKQGSFFLSFSIPIFSNLNFVAIRSGNETARIRVRKKKLGRAGFFFFFDTISCISALAVPIMTVNAVFGRNHP